MHWLHPTDVCEVAIVSVTRATLAVLAIGALSLPIIDAAQPDTALRCTNLVSGVSGGS